MGAPYSGSLFRRMQTDPVFRDADELVRAIERRLKLAKSEVEGLAARIRDPRSSFTEIGNAQCELDDARKRFDGLRVELEQAQEKRNALLVK